MFHDFCLLLFRLYNFSPAYARLQTLKHCQFALNCVLKCYYLTLGQDALPNGDLLPLIPRGQLSQTLASGPGSSHGLALEVCTFSFPPYL